ncbi:MAG: hypothetical protein JW776_12090 [Candidatus Lokiarchaeota archaeon]|nr:hypothetical protein [Candidatus Lokiarchaeota archaeon]
MALSPVFLQTLVNFLHNVFTAMWVGGMLTLLFAVMPSMRKILGKSKESQALNTQIKKTLSVLTYISIVGLIITGLMMGKKAQLAGDYTGFFSFGTEYSTLLSIKHLLYILMVALAIFRSVIVDRLKKPTQEMKMKINMYLLILNVIAGLAVLLLSSNIAVLASIP